MNRMMMVSLSVWALVPTLSVGQVTPAVQDQANLLVVSLPRSDGSTAATNVGEYISRIEAVREQVFQSVQAKVARGDDDLSKELASLEKFANLCRKLDASLSTSGGASDQVQAWLRGNLNLADGWLAVLKGQRLEDADAVQNLQKLGDLDSLDGKLARRVRNLQKVAASEKLQEKWRQRAARIREASALHGPQIAGIARFGFRLGTNTAAPGDLVPVNFAMLFGTIRETPIVNLDVAVTVMNSRTGARPRDYSFRMQKRPGVDEGINPAMRLDTAGLADGDYVVQITVSDSIRALKDFDFLKIKKKSTPTTGAGTVAPPAVDWSKLAGRWRLIKHIIVPNNRYDPYELLEIRIKNGQPELVQPPTRMSKYEVKDGQLTIYLETTDADGTRGKGTIELPADGKGGRGSFQKEKKFQPGDPIIGDAADGKQVVYREDFDVQRDQ